MVIISQAGIRRGSLFTLAFLLLAGVSASAGDVTLHKVPPFAVDQVSAYPQNLARYYFGANIETTPQSQPIANLSLGSETQDQNTSEAALLCSDSSVGYVLPVGATAIVVTLPAVENVASVSFLNGSAKGELSVATSNAKLPADSSKWQMATTEQLTPETMRAQIGPSEAKYLRLTFSITEPGRIAGLGVYSAAHVSDFTRPRASKMAIEEKSDNFVLISSSLTDMHTKARALYVSSGSDAQQANNMIDDQTGSTYSFAADDGSPTAVVDLGKACTLRRLSAVYSPRAGNVSFYVLETLPGSKVYAGIPEPSPDTIKLDNAAFASLKPVGTVEDGDGCGRASVNFPATSGRYVMLRWTPAQPQDGSFFVAEIGAFGKPNQPDSLVAANNSVSIAEVVGTESDGKTMLDDKTMIETKDVPAEGPVEGVPPNLPQPPPFTLVPVVEPVSP